jgi:hypothetical protein
VWTVSWDVIDAAVSACKASAMPGTVSTLDAGRDAGLSYRQVSYWIAAGAVTPMYGNGGSGFPYRFTLAQAEHLRQIGILHRMLEPVGGTTVEFIGRVWASLESTGAFRFEDGPVVISLPWPPTSDPGPAA